MAKRSQLDAVGGAQTLAKGLMLLNLIAERQKDAGVSLALLTRELGWNKSTIHRLLSTLVTLGYAQQNSRNGLYRLGLKTLQLGAAYSRDFDLRKSTAPILNELVEKTGCGSSLVILDPAAGEVVYIDSVGGTHAFRMQLDIGMRFPWNCTAAGKAIAAFLKETELKSLVAGRLARRTTSSLHTAHALRADFSKIKISGYAIDDGENSDGVRCVASPIFDSAERPIGAISMSGYIGQIPPENIAVLGELVRKAARRVSRGLGYGQH